MAAGKYYWFTKAEEVRDKRSFYIHSNSADLATKIIPGGLKRSRMVDGLLYDIESNSKYEELNSTPTA